VCCRNVFTDPMPSNGYHIVSCTCVAGMCLPTRYLAMGIHVTILYISLPETKSVPMFVLKIVFHVNQRRRQEINENQGVKQRCSLSQGVRNWKQVIKHIDVCRWSGFNILQGRETTERNVPVNLNWLSLQDENISKGNTSNDISWEVSDQIKNCNQRQPR
jgi:hypothetical protein